MTSIKAILKTGNRCVFILVCAVSIFMMCRKNGVERLYGTDDIYNEIVKEENADNNDSSQSDVSVFDVSKGDLNGAIYYLVTIPKVRSDGKRTLLKVGLADNTPGHVKKVTEFAQEKASPVAINGGFFRRKDKTNLPYGVVIIDGRPVYSGVPYNNVRNAQTLAIMEDGSFRYYPSAKPNMKKMIADGVKQAVTGRQPIIRNGRKTDYKDAAGRLQIIGYDAENYYILTSEPGLKMSDAGTFLLKKGLQEAYVLDGGGSVSTSIYSKKLNSNKDNNGKTERRVATFLYIIK